jgi:DNA end-binding protein Ku
MEALRASVAAAGSKKKKAASGNAAGAGSEDPTKKTAAKSSRPASASSGAKARSELADMSKQELYDKATELNVAGRSKMTRKELEEAIEDASSERRSRKAS